MSRFATSMLSIVLNWIAVIPAAGQPPPILAEAPVTAIEVPGRFTPDVEAFVLVEGKFRNGCFKWVGAEVQQKPNFITEIRGFAQMTQGMCIQVIVPFREQVALGHLAAGTYDVHFVRSDGSYVSEQLTIQ